MIVGFRRNSTLTEKNEEEYEVRAIYEIQFNVIVGTKKHFFCKTPL